MTNSGLPGALIGLGLTIALVGVVLLLVGKVPWLGRLPGDIAIERDNFSFYFPITTSILVSLGLSILFWLLRR